MSFSPAASSARVTLITPTESDMSTCCFCHYACREKFPAESWRWTMLLASGGLSSYTQVNFKSSDSTKWHNKPLHFLELASSILRRNPQGGEFCPKLLVKRSSLSVIIWPASFAGTAVTMLVTFHAQLFKEDIVLAPWLLFGLAANPKVPTLSSRRQDLIATATPPRRQSD